MSTIATPELLTVREAAERLHVSRATAYRLIERGELPALRVGHQLRIDGAWLEDWIASSLLGTSGGWAAGASRPASSGESPEWSGD
jgi:excisionase family DNA binding protein